MAIRRFLAFIAVLTSLTGLIHFYLWRRLIVAPAWPEPWPLFLTTALASLGALLPLSPLLWRRMPRALAAPWVWLAYLWMGLSFYLLLFTLAFELPRLWFDPSVSARTWALVAAGSTLVAGAVGMVDALARLVVEHQRVPLDKLDPRLDGFRIVQLSDVHVGPTIGRRFVRKVVDKVNALDADVVVITGDLVDGDVDELAKHVAPLAELKARHGVFFITGNHEYYSGAASWVAHLRSLGLKVLRNEHVSIEREGAGIALAGVDDWSSSHFGAGKGHDVAAALAGRPAHWPVVLLAHQPKSIEEAAAQGVDLQLSGHTHGGQMSPFHWLVRLDQPYLKGLHRHRDTWIYVSRGTGYWGPPMRVGAPAEISLIELSSAAATASPG